MGGLFKFVENFGSGGFFLVTLFLAEEEKVTGSKGFETKPSWMKARSVLFYLKISLGQCSSSDYFVN
jgi:hypothetical protein